MPKLLPHLVIIVILVSIVFAWFSLAPWVPTLSKDLKRINKIAKLKPGQTFLELGCGDGRVCSYIARQNPKAKVIGIELAFPFYVFTKLRVALCGPKNVQIVFGDALKYDISDIDVLYVFGLMETVNKKIKQKIDKQMKPKAKLISYVFAMQKWSGKETKYKEGKNISGIYVYEY